MFLNKSKTGHMLSDIDLLLSYIKTVWYQNKNAKQNRRGQKVDRDLRINDHLIYTESDMSELWKRLFNKQHRKLTRYTY